MQISILVIIYSIGVEAENCGGPVAITHAILIGEGAATVVEPGLGATLVYTDSQGSPTTIKVPPGSLTETTSLMFLPGLEPLPPPEGFDSSGHAFDLDAYRNGVLLPALEFDPPFTVTITYTDTDVIRLDESTLGLWFWDGAGWSTEGISMTGHVTITNQFEATSSHLSTFALFGAKLGRVYLPLILKAP